MRRAARAARDAFNRGVVAVARRARLGEYVVLDYPASARRVPQARRDGRLHDAVASAEPAYRDALRTIAAYADDLVAIDGALWRNEFLPGLDAAAIYAFLRARKPATYLEVGSGSSTRFARHAIADGGLSTRIVSIDPRPRADVEELCDVAVRMPLEVADPALFDALQPGDVVFVDGTHRTFTGSDATVFVLDLLPALKPGVLVGVHDVYLPDDYPPSVTRRHYSEQYLLGALLLGKPDWLSLVLAADYVAQRRELAEELGALWSRPELAGVETHGVSFWLETSGG
jgi:predicted O-methyltransferase YrrM